MGGLKGPAGVQGCPKPSPPSRKTTITTVTLCIRRIIDEKKDMCDGRGSTFWPKYPLNLTGFLKPKSMVVCTKNAILDTQNDSFCTPAPRGLFGGLHISV